MQQSARPHREQARQCEQTTPSAVALACRLSVVVLHSSQHIAATAPVAIAAVPAVVAAPATGMNYEAVVVVVTAALAVALD